MHVGDRVEVNGRKFPGVWVIEKVNPTTFKLRREGQGPTGQRLRAHKTMVRPAGAEVTPVAVRTLPHQAAGSVVRYVGTTLRKSPERDILYVVLKDNYDRLHISMLGGEGDRYWRVAPRNLEAVDVLDVLGASSS